MDELATGLGIAAAGMAIVLGLLVLLWALLEVALRLESRSAGAADARPRPGAIAIQPTDGGALDPETVAAIALAVARHAELRRRQAAPAMRLYWPGSLLFASRWVAAGRTRQGQSWRRR